MDTNYSHLMGSPQDALDHPINNLPQPIAGQMKLPGKKQTNTQLLKVGPWAINPSQIPGVP